MTSGKTIALTIQTFVGKVMSLLFNTLSRLVIVFLPRSNCLLIHGCSHHPPWFLEPKKRKSSLLLPFPLSFAIKWWSDRVRCDDLSFFLILSFKPAFSLSSFTLIEKFLVPFHFLPLEWYYPHIWSCWYFTWQSLFQLVPYSVGISHDMLCM